MKKWILGLFLVLCACSWRTPNSTFYMMNSDGLEPVSNRKISVSVARIKVPDLLDRSQIVVYEKNDGEVKIDEFNRWGEAFPEVLQATVTNDLMAYLPNAFIKRTYFDSGNLDYSVNIEINQMAAYVGDKVVLSAWWNIANASGRVVKRSQEKFAVPMSGNTMEDVVKAQNAAVHQLSKAIAEQLKRL
jgi:uncharacterized lipoprotein YmbA